MPEMSEEGTESGYLSVEASLLFPLILYCLILLLYLIFYTLEGGMIHAVSCEVLSGRSLYKADTSEIENTLKKKLAQRVFFTRKLSVNVNQSGKKIKVSVSGRIEIPILPLKRLFGKGDLRFTRKVIAGSEDPIDLLRRRKILEETIHQ